MPEEIGADLGSGWVQVGTLVGDIIDSFAVDNTWTLPTSTSSTYSLSVNSVNYNWVTNTVDGVPVERYPYVTIDHMGTETAWAALTPEQAARRVPHEAQAEATRAAEERARVRHAAMERATALLLSLLNESQVEDYTATNCFNVQGSLGNVYRIHPGSMGNVEWFDSNGASGGWLCAHPEMCSQWLPDADIAVAQMLAITTDERAWVNIANVHRGRRPVLAPDRWTTVDATMNVNGITDNSVILNDVWIRIPNNNMTR